MTNLILYGPPGTGKTRSLLGFVAEHMKANPGRVLFSSHTKAAAYEATSRFADEALVPRIDIQTLHSLCFRGLKMSKAQTVDDAKLEAFGQEFGIEFDGDSLGKEFLDVLSLSRARCTTPEQGYEKSWRPGTPAHYDSFCRSYAAWKESFGYMDFDDMLHVGSTRLSSQTSTYSLIVIDEAQDLTPLHWRVIRRLVYLNPKTRVLVAGDDDQALYSFAGADPMAMKAFGDETKAESVVLSQSYRITKQVHGLAMAIIERVQNRVPKEYAPRRDLLSGQPAHGVLEFWPHLDHMQLDRDRDTLVLYADRFVRSEVEPFIQSEGYNYRALNGWPSPQDSRAGKAIGVALNHTFDDIIDADDLRSTVRNGLTGRGVTGWEVNPREVLTRIKRGDWSMLTVKENHIEYLKSLDYSRPQNIRLSTMHGAKGLQADDVHLTLTLSSRAWQEAMVEPDHLHRLLYTAVTRAKENLHLYDGENAYEMPL